jgi:hypothetical protein
VRLQGQSAGDGGGLRGGVRLCAGSWVSLRRLVAGKRRQFSRFACGFAPAFGRAEGILTGLYWHPFRLRSGQALKPCPFKTGGIVVEIWKTAIATEGDEVIATFGLVALQVTGYGYRNSCTLYPTHPQRTRMNGAPGRVAERAERGNAFQDLAARQGSSMACLVGWGGAICGLRKSSMRG